MRENIEAVCRHYDEDPQREWDRLGESHPFEFILTTWMMDRYIKPGGKFYASFIQVFGGLIYDLKNGGNIAPDCRNAALLPAIEAVGTGENARCEGGFTHSYMWHPRNILPFMDRFGLKKLHLFGQEGITSPNEPQLLERDKEEFAQWVELAKKYLEVPELLAFSEHAMYIGEKL